MPLDHAELLGKLLDVYFIAHWVFSLTLRSITLLLLYTFIYSALTSECIQEEEEHHRQFTNLGAGLSRNISWTTLQDIV